MLIKYMEQQEDRKEIQETVSKHGPTHINFSEIYLQLFGDKSDPPDETFDYSVIKINQEIQIG